MFARPLADWALESVQRGVNMARFGNIVEKINRGRFGVSVTITTVGSTREDVGRRFRQSDAVDTVRMRVVEQKIEGETREIVMSLSGVAGYTPRKDDKMLINDVQYKICDIVIKQAGAEIYEYHITGVA